MVMPGSLGGQLGLRVGDLVGRPSRPERVDATAEKKASPPPSPAAVLIGFAQGNGSSRDATVRQGLAQLHIIGELGRFNAARLKSVREAGGDIPGMANIAKLSMSNIVRLQRDLGLAIAGPQGMLHAYTDEQRTALDAATGNPFLGMITGPALYAQAPPIYGGTDQIQRNIIGERVLGLPKEPGPDAATPFSQLPRNS
jgi:alkylation response protein AidB-like acyl-CoA dehydrogenase